MYVFYCTYFFMQFPVLDFGLVHSGSQPFRHSVYLSSFSLFLAPAFVFGLQYMETKEPFPVFTTLLLPCT